MFIPARGIGVVGAVVISVGVSGEAVLGGGRRRLVLAPVVAPFLGAATG
jgi:hypothetical protein